MLKNLKPFFSLLLMAGVLSIVFVGCVDEPTIEPYQMPYASIKFANFSTNIDVVDIRIDTKWDYSGPLKPINQFTDLNGSSVKNNLATTEVTEYFDIRSGERHVQLFDAGENMIFENMTLQADGYGEIIYFIVGTYDDNEDNSTLEIFSIVNGYTYLDDFHQKPTSADDDDHIFMTSTQLSLKCVNALYDDYSTTVDGIKSPVLDSVICESNADTISIFRSDRVTLTQNEPEIKPGEYGLITEPFEAGNYDVFFVSGEDTLVSSNYDLAAETITYLVLYGYPTNPKLAKVEEAIMTEARPK